MAVQIKKATTGDSAEIARVYVETWKDTYKGLLPDSYLDNLSISKRDKIWKWEIENSEKNNIIVLIAKLNNKIVGFSSIGKSRDRDTDDLTGELETIYVDPIYQHQGIGTKLLIESCKYMKNLGYKKIILWVLTTNKKARTFYELRGWKIEGKIKIESRDKIKTHQTRYIFNI